MTVHATGKSNTIATELDARGGAGNQIRKKPKNNILDFSAAANTQYFGHLGASVWTESVPNATRS